jgi:hypothetical protein
MHSSIYEEGLDHHFLGFEFHAPKSCLGDVSIVIDTAVKELSAIMDDFYAELDRVFPSQE